MLDLMRKHAKSWIINVIIGAIVIVFIFWGAGSFRKRQPKYVALVNDEPISYFTYHEALNRIYQNARARYGAAWNEDMVQLLNLKQQALEGLINDRLVLQRAQALNLQVSNEELQQSILNTSYFKVDGVFNERRYDFLLSQNRLTRDEYETMERRRLLTEKMSGAVAAMAKVSPGEIEDFFHFTQDRVDLDFLLFKPQNFENKVEATEAERKSYYEAHKEKFKKPAQVRVAYVFIRPRDVAGEVVIDPVEIKEEYEFNKTAYTHKEEVQARHILFRLDENAPLEEVKKVRAEAEKVLKMAQKGADFAKLAREYSQDGSAKVGGELGWFDRDRMVEPFADAAFSLKKGQVSGLVRTQFGLHIIQVEDRRPGGTQPLDQVRPQIEAKIRQRRAVELAADRASEFFEKANLSQDFNAAATELKLIPVETKFFAQDQPIPDLGLRKQFNAVAFSLKPGEIGPVVDFADGHAVIKALEDKPAYIPDFKEVEGDVRADLVNIKATAMAAKEAQRVLALIQENGWSKEIKALGLTPDSTGPMNRMNPNEKIGRQRDLLEAAFLLKEEGQVASKVFSNDKGSFIVRLKNSDPASPLELVKNKAQFTYSLTVTKGREYVNEWLKTIRAMSTIKVEESLL